MPTHTQNLSLSLYPPAVKIVHKLCFLPKPLPMEKESFFFILAVFQTKEKLQTTFKNTRGKKVFSFFFYWRWTVRLHSSISGYGISISLKQANFIDPQKNSIKDDRQWEKRKKKKIVDALEFSNLKINQFDEEIYGLICFVWTIGDEKEISLSLSVVEISQKKRPTSSVTFCGFIFCRDEVYLLPRKSEEFSYSSSS